jgi:small conductance mechanosensitive channel
VIHAFTNLTALPALHTADGTPPPSPTPSPSPLQELPVDLWMPDLSSLTWSGVGDWLVGTPLLIITVLAVGLLARFLLHRLINRVVTTATSRRAERIASLPGAGRALQAVGVANVRHVQRTQTMGALLKSITTFVVGGITALTVLSLVGIPLGPMLASASVGGVALPSARRASSRTSSPASS